ncbi:MAG: prepilin-type N-terminal cleavage/methylation domain-containing protein [Luteimonas sp.]
MITLHRHSAATRGFSLIEVLIAVVVLATGLLALAALQGSLTRASSEAKVRSRVAALLTARMDQVRAGTYNGAIASTDTCLATSADNWVPATICTENGLGALSATQTVQSWSSAVGGSFTAAAPANSELPQFKRVIVSANWTDASGGDHRLAMTTDLSELTLKGDLIPPPEESSAGTKGPTVRTLAPSNVIPIGIGTNTDTAATNPRPTLGKSLPATTFNVLTYQGSGGGVQIQQRVETSVVECMCKNGPQGTANLTGIFAIAKYRPTYWDGNRYIAREAMTGAPAAGPFVAANVNPNDHQSRLCTECCRDQHDTTADTVKYDNLSADYAKYHISTSPVGNGQNQSYAVTPVRNTAGVWQQAGANDQYIQACRLIRVDGFWQVATALESKHMGLLATTPRNEQTSQQPDPGAASVYEDFVLSYLSSKVGNAVNSTSLPDANALYNTFGLNEDTLTTLGSRKHYLHGRGLYIDHLEQAAITAIKDAYDGCTNIDKTQCALKHIPFNTINVTELANWDETNPVVLTVSNGSVPDQGDPIRGVVDTIGNGTASAVATMGLSNSAVAASLAINPAEEVVANQQTGDQEFRVVSSLQTSRFDVLLTGLGQTSDLSTSNDPGVRWGVQTASGRCSSTLSRSDTDPNDYNCRTTQLPVLPVFIDVTDYNQVLEKDARNPCGTGTVRQPYLQCYRVSSVTVPSGTSSTTAVTNPKAKNESSRVSVLGLGQLPADARLILNFSSNGSADATPSTCDISGSFTWTVPTACP